MSRKMPAGWIELSQRKDKQIESRSTLKISIDTPKVVRTYYFATAELQIDNVTWEPLMKRGDRISAALTRAADLATAEIANVDALIGREFLKLGPALYGAEMKVGRFKRDLVSGVEVHKVFLTGPIVNFQVNEEAVKLTAVSEAFANINVGANRDVGTICGWIFRDPSTCQYAGTEMECNLLLNHAGGCEGRHGTPLKFAKNGSFAFVSSQARLKTI